MLSLVMIGEPLRIVFSRYSTIFRNLDVLQISVLDVYLGGFIVYVIALAPIGLFTPNILLGTLLFSTLFVLIFYSQKFYFWRKEKQPIRFPDNKSIICQTVVLFLFLVMLWITIAPTTNFILGNVHDSSLYSLFAKVILENHQIPQTLQPYSPEGIIYPQGFFVVLAFVNVLPLHFSLAETPLLITPLFQALSILGAYYLGKVLGGRKLGMSLAFVFAFVSRWPLLLVWGSNAFVYGFPLYFIALAFIPNLQNARVWNKTVVIELIGIGLLYGYLAASHFTLYSVLTLSVIIGLIPSLFNRSRFLESLRFNFRTFVIILTCSLLVLGVFIFRALIWYPYPAHNLGLPTDVSVQSYPPFNPVDWLLYSEGISPSTTLTLESLLIIGISIIGVSIGTLYYYWRCKKVDKSVKIVIFSLIGAGILFAIGSLTGVYPSLSIFVAEPVRPTILFLVSLAFLIGIFNLFIYQRLRNVIQTRFNSRFLTKKRHNALAILASIMILSSIYVPYLQYTFENDVDYMIGQYNMFCVTTQDDLKLMQWIGENISKTSLVLVNPYDAGEFIPVVSGIRIIYPFTGSSDSKAYKTLVELIDQEHIKLDYLPTIVVV